MLSLNSFVIADDSDANHLSDAESSGLELDQLDFFVDGYHVDERRFPVLGKALIKGKARVQEENEDFWGDEELPTHGYTPSSSTANISSEEEGQRTDSRSQTASEADMGLGNVRQRLDYPELDVLAVSEGMPHSAPTLGSGSVRQASKRRKRDTTSERASPLGRVSTNTENSEILLRLQAAEVREKQLEEKIASQQESLAATVAASVAAQMDMFMRNIANMFPNAAAVNPSLHPVPQETPTTQVQPQSASPSSAADDRFVADVPSSTPEPSHQSPNVHMRDPSPSPPHSPFCTQTQGDGPETSSGPSQT